MQWRLYSSLRFVWGKVASDLLAKPDLFFVIADAKQESISCASHPLLLP
jgi:hypothetical protein